jgi:hypothetical protein
MKDMNALVARGERVDRLQLLYSGIPMIVSLFRRQGKEKAWDFFWPQ